MFTSKRFPFFGVVAVVFWFCGVYAACPLGDLTEDGVVNAADLRAFSGAWLTSAANPADLNGDSQVNMADFDVLAGNWLEAGEAVIINEIHTNPDVKTELVEFVELYNPGAVDVDLSGWCFTAASTWLVFFMLGKQAFMNYFYVIMYALWMAFAAARAEGDDTASQSAPAEPSDGRSP